MTRIVIAGAGIGGLTTALACLRQGMNVVLLESAPELRAVGAGIQLPPNAMKVLDALGLGPAIRRHAFRPEAIEARMGVSGREIFNIPLAEEAEARWGASYLHIHRADYIAALADALPEGVLRLGEPFAQFDTRANGVTVTLEDGATIEAEALIGADGIHSAVRTQMLGPQPARFTGNVAWRATVPVAALGKHAPRPTACAWFGPGRHAVTYRLGAQGELANFVGVVEREDWREEGWTIPGSREEAAVDFVGWHPTVTTLIAQAESLNKWALFDRDPLPRWTQGRVALLGDAAHPMLPFLAQGAAMAVEDAWVLADRLKALPVEAALAAYQNIRLPRTTRVQAASRANMTTFHRRTVPSQLATYGPMWLAGRIAPTLVHRRMDWLYGHDVTG